MRNVADHIFNQKELSFGPPHQNKHLTHRGKSALECLFGSEEESTLKFLFIQVVLFFLSYFVDDDCELLTI